MGAPLSIEQIAKMHAYWCAANYLSVGQIYLQDNPLRDRHLGQRGRAVMCSDNAGICGSGMVRLPCVRRKHY